MVHYQAGDTVLIGRPEYVMPRGWVIAQLTQDGFGFYGVVFRDGKRICREPLCPDDIRAVGPVPYLQEFQRECEQRLAPLLATWQQAADIARIHEANFWDKLREIAQGVPNFAIDYADAVLAQKAGAEGAP
jgi:hypothetical protein